MKDRKSSTRKAFLPMLRPVPPCGAADAKRAAPKGDFWRLLPKPV